MSFPHFWTINSRTTLLIFQTFSFGNVSTPPGRWLFPRLRFRTLWLVYLRTDLWNIPQTLNHLFMKETLPYLYFGVPGVCSRGLFEFSLSYVSPFYELSLAQMFKLQLLGFGGNGNCYWFFKYILPTRFFGLVVLFPVVYVNVYICKDAYIPQMFWMAFHQQLGTLIYVRWVTSTICWF